jgi:cobalt/nickel transport system permease protein
LLEIYKPVSSPIHQLEARVKIIFTLVFIIAISFMPSGAWPAYILIYSIILSLIISSNLGMSFVLKRALLATPFVFAAIPLIIYGPEPVVQTRIFEFIVIPISETGFLRFLSIAIKSWMSVQLAIILAATTHFADLMGGFRALKFPAIFISTIELMWRYLFLIIEETSRLIRARSSRSTTISGNRKSGGSVFWRAQVTGGMAGSLFLRSIERSERVYAAMLARGYNGTPIERENQAFGKEEWWLTIATILISGFILFIAILTGV